jgi:hypothetical protein
MFGKIDWDEYKENLFKNIKTFAVIDWTDFDKFLGTDVKKIYIYSGGYVVSEIPYNEVEVKHLSKFMPVVDLTGGRPYPEDFEKVPKFWSIFGRLNLAELEI